MTGAETILVWQNLTWGFTHEKGDILSLHLCSNMPRILYPVEVNKYSKQMEQNNGVKSIKDPLFKAHKLGWQIYNYGCHVGVGLSSELVIRGRLSKSVETNTIIP